jgi:hypothetical protein
VWLGCALPLAGPGGGRDRARDLRFALWWNRCLGPLRWLRRRLSPAS